MEKKKINLDKIKVESFVTRLENNEKQTVGGGNKLVARISYDFTVDWPCHHTDMPWCLAVSVIICDPQ